MKLLIFFLFTAGLSYAQSTDTIRFENGTIKSIGARNEADKKNGEWRIYYENGQLKSVIHYQNGKEHGKWETYHENGILSSIGQFQNGTKSGEWKYFHSNGNRKTIANYDTGEIQEFGTNGHPLF